MRGTCPSKVRIRRASPRNKSMKFLCLFEGLKADLVERLTEALKNEDVSMEQEISVDKKSTEPIIQPAEEQSNQSEEGQPDLANMVVIDECCDPTKQKADESPKEKAPVKSTKKRDEKELRQLERRYTIPDSPEIVVHVSKTAKGGKFDCSLMSLAMLRNYDHGDSKEHSFEVYLFAELFSEMLLRDSAYNIFRAISALPERKEEERVTVKEAKEEANKRDEKKDKKDEGKVDKEVPDEDSADKKKRDKERKKQVTVHPELLLAFSYYDLTNCGYIQTRDLEELFSTIGLSLSRGQIKKVVGKASASESFYYR